MADGTATSGAGATPDLAGAVQAPLDPTLINQIHAETAQEQAIAQANDPEDPGTDGINPRTARARIRHAQAATVAANGAGFQFTPDEVPGQGQSPPTGQTASRTTTPNSPTSGGSKAPAVAKPLNAAHFVGNPCSALTATDLAGLNVTNPVNGGTHQNAGGVQCTWTGESGGSVSIGWETADTNGLSNLYAKSNTIAYWQPTTVGGVTDQLCFDAQFSNPSNAGQSCALAQRAASDVIKNLGSS